MQLPQSSSCIKKQLLVTESAVGLYRIAKLQPVYMHVTLGAEDDEWDDEWDDVKSSGGYAESESGESGAMQRGGAHGSSMKISLNK